MCTLSDARQRPGPTRVVEGRIMAGQITDSQSMSEIGKNYRYLGYLSSGEL